MQLLLPHQAIPIPAAVVETVGIGEATVQAHRHHRPAAAADAEMVVSQDHAGQTQIVRVRIRVLAQVDLGGKVSEAVGAAVKVVEGESVPSLVLHPVQMQYRACPCDIHGVLVVPSIVLLTYEASSASGCGAIVAPLSTCASELQTLSPWSMPLPAVHRD